MVDGGGYDYQAIGVNTFAVTPPGWNRVESLCAFITDGHNFRQWGGSPSPTT